MPIANCVEWVYDGVVLVENDPCDLMLQGLVSLVVSEGLAAPPGHPIRLMS